MGWGARRGLVVAVALVLLVLVATPAGAANRAKRTPGPVRIVLAGDSLTVDYQSAAAPLLAAKGYAVFQAGIGGHGLLDKNACHGGIAKSLLARFDADIVVYEANGNYGTFPFCKTRIDYYGGPSFYDKWKRAATLTQRVLTRHGARFLWILVPSVRDGYKAGVIQPLNAIYSQVAAAKPTLTGTIDAWTAFGGANFDQSLHKDDQHLNEAGAALMANLVVDAVG